MSDWDRTRPGQKFFNDISRIAKALESIDASLDSIDNTLDDISSNTST